MRKVNAISVIFILLLSVTGSVFAQSPGETTKVWQSFGDTTLSRLISRAMEANTDVRVAVARLSSARASRRLSLFDVGPQINVQGSALRQRLPLAQTPGVTSQLPQQDLWDAGFDASWEIDIFARRIRTAAAQNAFSAAAQYNLHDVQLSIAAEVARAYFDLRGAQRQLSVALQNADNQRKTLKIAQDRLDAGRGTAFDTERAKAALNLTLSTAPLIETRIAADENRLSVLIGEDPKMIHNTFASASETLSLPDSISVDSLEQFIKRRPDVLGAERQMAANALLVGVARTEYLPHLTFGASTGYTASKFDSLGANGTKRYLIGPVVSWSLLDIGRVKSRVDIAQAQKEEARARYTAIMLTASEDARTALVAYDRARTRLKVLDEAVLSSTRAVDLAQQRFEAGLTDLLQVLDAQRTLLDAENLRAQGHTDAATALVALIKALGGSWPTL